jgi:hypothetical protein
MSFHFVERALAAGFELTVPVNGETKKGGTAGSEFYKVEDRFPFLFLLSLNLNSHFANDDS